MYKNRFFIAGSLLVIIIIFFIPFNIPLTLEVPCKIRPVNSWVLKLQNNGSLVTSLYNSKTGTIEDYFSSVPDRGDNYGFTLLKKNFSESWANKGDTLGLITSNLSALQMAELSGRLTTAKGNLNLLLSGEKESLVNYAREQLNAAIEQSKYLNVIYGRKKALFDEGLLSEEDLETFKSEAKLSEIDISVKKANLESVTSGEKFEQINLVKSEIQAIEKEIAILQQKLSSFVITAPLSGKITAYNSVDTVLSVNSKDYVLIIPVNWKYQSLLEIGIKVELIVNDENLSNFKIEKIRPDVSKFNGQQVIIAIAGAEEITYDLPENLWLKCNLELGDFSILEYIKWKLQYSYEL